MLDFTNIAMRAASSTTRLASGDDTFGPRPSRNATRVGPSSRLTGKRILIVEDEALVALDLEFAFQDEGAEVVGPALSLRDALSVLGSDASIDGAVLDVDLGGKDVFPVAELLCARGVPFVFHTGHATRASLDKPFPGVMVCTKPTLPTALIAVLLRLIN
jgi:CheY-like chemotaxis protein